MMGIQRRVQRAVITFVKMEYISLMSLNRIIDLHSVLSASVKGAFRVV